MADASAGSRRRHVALRLAALALVGCLLGVAPATAAPLPREEADDEPTSWELFQQVWDLIQQDFLYESALDARRLAYAAATGPLGAGSRQDGRQVTYAAIRSLVDSLGDPNTRFLTPRERQVESAGYSGRLEGIGACLEPRAGFVEVSALVPGAPAARAGVRSGDHLLGVDGRDVAGLPIEDLVLRIRGPSGSTVALALARPAGDQRVDLTLNREEIQLPSAWGQLLAPRIGLLRIVAFTEQTDREGGAALDELRAGGVSALVLDLRGNLGGLLEPAVEVASRFTTVDPIAWKEDRRGERTPYARQDQPLVTWPLVVLVDGRTASAAEVMAAALRDAGRGRLVGQRTYGKGTIQHIYDLRDGSALHVTAARWVSPAGTPLDRGGLEPDVPVEASSSAEAALDLAIGLLQTALGERAGPTERAALQRYDCGPNSPHAV